MSRDEMHARVIVSIRRFRVCVCPTWWFGYQSWPGGFIAFVIPGLGIGWVPEGW